jgi:hypothetical protein
VAPAALVTACAGPVPSLVPLGGVSEPKPEKKRAARSERKTEKPTAASATNDDDDADDTVAVSGDADGGGGPTPAAMASAAASAEAAPPAKIDGEYVGLDVAVYRVEGMPDRTERDPKARTLLRTPDDTSAEVVILDSGTGKEICALEGDRKGNAITLRAGQTCFEQSGGTKMSNVPNSDWTA